jgi:hypothetical protein
MDDDEHGELVRRLFYVITAKLEDAFTQAAEGQGREPTTDRIKRAGLVHTAAQEVLILADATTALIQASADILIERGRDHRRQRLLRAFAKRWVLGRQIGSDPCRCL